MRLLENLVSHYTLLDVVYPYSNDKNFQINSLIAANHAIFIVSVNSPSHTLRNML